VLVAVIVPTLELPFKIQFTYHPTPTFVVPVTVAVNGAVPPASTLAVRGATATATVDCVTVTVEGAEVVPFATDTAVTETVAGFGTVVGAVYTAVVVPLEPLPAVSVPNAGLPFWTPFTYHVTAVTWGPVTVAVKFCVLPPDTVALVGDTVTVVCWLPPLPGALAMHPAKGNIPASAITVRI